MNSKMKSSSALSNLGHKYNFCMLWENLCFCHFGSFFGVSCHICYFLAGFFFCHFDLFFQFPTSRAETDFVFCHCGYFLAVLNTIWFLISVHHQELLCQRPETEFLHLQTEMTRLQGPIKLKLSIDLGPKVCTKYRKHFVCFLGEPRKP